MARRLQKTLIDYIVIAINPVLIMFLIGSLLYFLLEVLYEGRYDGRLQFIFAMFVMAAVLIGRVAIEEGKERAGVFAIPLAVVTYLALFRFVQFQGPLAGISWLLNLLLIGLVWWCAHKLTWDCTLIDDEQDASGEGLLQTAGLDERAEARKKVDVPAQPEPEGVTSRDAGELTWWRRLTERDRRPHAPGVWIIYFSLAALPIFAFGQRFVPADDTGRRGYVFFLFLIYVASGLGLLLNTSFLGLRRYLRQRRVEMPAAMAGMWLALGVALIVGLLAAAAILPRPNAEYAMADLSFHVGSPSHESSRYGVGTDGADEDQGGRRTGKKQTEETPDSGAGGEGEPSGGQSQQGGGQSGSESESGDDSSSSGSQSEKGESSSGSEQKSGSSGSDSQSNQQGSGSDSQNEQDSQSGSQSRSEDPGSQAKEAIESDSGEGQESSGGESQDRESRPGSETDRGEDRSSAGDQSGGQDSRQGEGSRSTSQDERSESRREQSESQDERSETASSSSEEPTRDQSGAQTDESEETESQTADDGSPSGGSERQSSFKPLSMLQNVGGFLFGLLKWIIFLAIILVGLYWIWRSREELLRFFRDLAQSWRALLARLFGGKPVPREDSTEEEQPKGPTGKLFADYADPFLSGAVESWSPDEVVKYTFEALEAWARERGCPRPLEQTPYEFAGIVGSRFKELSQGVRRLADLYSQVAYAPGSIPPGRIEPLREFWLRLQRPETVPA